MYTIKQARQGKVAIKNDGTPEELDAVTDKKLGDADYYYCDGSGRWWGTNDPPHNLPVQSVKDFLIAEEAAPDSATWEPKWGEEVEVTDDGIQWRKKYKYVGKHPAGEGHVVFNLTGDIVTCYAAVRRPLQSVTLTRQEIADKFDIAVEKLKIVE